EEMQSYYNDNRDNLMQYEQYVDFDYAYFETQEEAKTFYDKAAEVGYDKALEESSVVENDSYTGLKKAETGEAFVDILFGNYDSPIRISYSDDGSFVFRVNKLNDMSTYELFKESQIYNDILGQIVMQKFDQYLNDRIKSEKVAIKTSDGYAIWIAIAKNEDMQKIYDTFYPVVFDKDGKVVTDDPWLLSGLLVSIEEAEKIDQYATEYNAIVEKLYNMGYKSFTILARMREISDSEQVKLEYNVALSNLLFQDIENGNIMSVFQYLYTNIGELEELTQSENPQIRQKALEYLYRMYKVLGDTQSALEYLQTLQSENPQYMDFDAALNELNQMTDMTGEENQ
ncbi:MAG TPA: peptidyl-prolyl cis-trans isomerase, partial [Fervidobacterium sp.]|nr:peptidyl-prolyl cis-trans isomerase [Fervidobacterium sp.]